MQVCGACLVQCGCVIGEVGPRAGQVCEVWVMTCSFPVPL